MEAISTIRRRTGLALVFIDNLDAIGRPAKLNRLIDKRVLAGSRFSVVENLLWARLPHVDNRRTFKMVRLQLGGRPAD
jgi:hypothetical protein